MELTLELPLRRLPGPTSQHPSRPMVPTMGFPPPWRPVPRLTKSAPTALIMGWDETRSSDVNLCDDYTAHNEATEGSQLELRQHQRAN